MATSNIASKPGEDGKTRVRQQLAAPALKICLPTAIKQQRKDDAWLRSSGRTATTLAKYPDLRIVLVSMAAKAKMQEHKAAGRVSIHTLSGCIRLRLLDQTVDVPAGHLLTLDCCVPHDVEALKQSTFLVTIAWRKSEAKAGGPTTP